MKKSSPLSHNLKNLKMLKMSLYVQITTETVKISDIATVEVGLKSDYINEWMENLQFLIMLK